MTRNLRASAWTAGVIHSQRPWTPGTSTSGGPDPRSTILAVRLRPPVSRLRPGVSGLRADVVIGVAYQGRDQCSMPDAECSVFEAQSPKPKARSPEAGADVSIA